MKYRGVIPIGLPEQKLKWSSGFDFKTRMNLARQSANILNCDKMAAICSTAITLIEQPKYIPNNNPMGMHPWSGKFPWAWKRSHWVRQPSGYFLCNEGTGDKTGIYFAFNSYQDAMLILCTIVQDRSLFAGRDYVKKWVGLDKPNSELARAFEFEKTHILNAW